MLTFEAISKAWLAEEPAIQTFVDASAAANDVNKGHR